MSIARHPGQKRTAAHIRCNWWWPTLTSNAAKYVTACKVCQHTKVRPGPLAGPLHPHNAPDAPWDVITADMNGPLPKSGEYSTTFIVVDKLTRMIIAVPTTTTLTAQGAACIFQDHVFKHFGIPKKIISDDGPQFAAEWIMEFYKKLDIQPNLSTAFCPQTNGQTECANREVENYLKVWTNNRKENWAKWLSAAELSINIKPVTATGVSPFELNHRSIPNFGVSPRRVSSNKSVEDFFKRMEAATKEAKAALEHTNNLMVEQENLHRCPTQNYIVGQKVWLEFTHINLPKAADGSKKLSDR